MHIIKLDAIESTSTFLKELVTKQVMENYTIVSSESQFGGRGQMGAKWISEPGKNLLFSVYIKDLELSTKNSVFLNYAVSIALYESLNEYGIPNLRIKWPNDILAGNKKLCGILIENSLNNHGVKNTIIGIGLNVNQQIFTEDLSNATSMKNCIEKTIDRESLLISVVKKIKKQIEKCNSGNFLKLKETYLSLLYKMEIPAMFRNSRKGIFIGKIVGVNSKGDLEIELEDESVENFGLKEIEFLR